ncbi:MAG: PEP-utilizing enzyme [Polyangiaceae bacterium]
MTEAERHALRSVVERATRGEISRADALRAVPAGAPALAEFSLDIDPRDAATARAVPAAKGAATGELSFSARTTLAAAAEGRAVILAVEETFPEDIDAMRAARGIVAIGGGLTGHAAIVSRGLGRPCVCGGSSVRRARPSGLAVEATGGGVTLLHEGDRIWFDGAAGLVALAPPKLVVAHEIATLLRWALDALGDARSLDEAFATHLPSDIVAEAQKR